MKILITGSGGFIASHVIEVLRKKKIETVGIQRHLGNTQLGKEHITPDITYFGDVTDKGLVDRAVSLCDGVMNLAGILGTQETVDNPYPSVQTNIIGALNVLEAVRRHGTPLVQIAVGNHWMNNSYSITKTTAERFALMYAKEHGARVNVVRALNAFGERQKFHPVRKMMPSFISRALRGEDIEVYGDGLQVMDFVYVKDVAEILFEVLYKDTYGRIYEAGTGGGLSVMAWAEKVIKLSNSRSKVVRLPMRPGEPAGSSVVAQDPYQFEYSDVDQKVLQTINWYRDNA